ncbi:hypothetical protein HBI24_124450 [Parastagonospora nodorum]|nr:hypothetical protein HBH49_021450 [Parastagonospora nodorum]KAH4254741.1 hypothetical protein HBI03_182300 [Parastagonospora nodorum]KAH4282838.1 hypothetical protein HBI04_015250 [Parastagonospora nodorum]KAH4993072.1 hypothetical protein HBI76_041340 [Parastagonospora nodorum]KAH5022571.1 hypothetical protein HBI74_143080 [Parastagonospora nodorum]
MLLKYAACLVAAVVRVAAHHPPRPRAPGVAFGLTPDYGTAVIHLKNGTTIPIAQVQGSAEYQAFMRVNTTAPADESSLCKWFAPTLDRLPSALGLNVDICRSPDLISTKALISSLKLSVESHLGTNICFASLVLDDPTSPQARIAEQALELSGLRQVMPTVRRAKEVLYDLESDQAPAFDEEPWTVLVLEYDAHWYSFGLYTIEEDGIVSYLEDPIHGPRISIDGQMDSLKKEIKESLASLPPSVERPRQLFMYGEQADNVELLDFLAENLGSDLVKERRADTSVYAGMGYMARAAHERMDDVQFETRDQSQGAWMCKWRSKLYKEDHEEL